MAKTENGAVTKVFYAVHLFLLNKSHIYNNMSQTEKASCKLFSILLMCSVIIITVHIKRMLNMPTFYHSDKTKAQLLGSQLQQCSLLEKGVTVSLYRKRHT